MKHVVLYSGGISSAYVAYLVLQEQKKEDVVLLHTPTYSENHDADIFRHKVARYLKMPITEWGDGRDIWELIEANNCIPGQFIPFCTHLLAEEYKLGCEKYITICTQGKGYMRLKTDSHTDQILIDLLELGWADFTEYELVK